MLPWKRNLLHSGLSLASLLMFFGTAFGRDLYWTEQKQILAADIDGGNVTLIFDGETSTPPMDSFAVDIQVTDDHIYWSGHDGSDIWRADRDGSNAVQLVSGTNSSIHSFDIDEDGGKIYFNDYNGRIMVADLADGANVAVGFSDSRLGQPSGLVIDRTATGEDAQILTVTANGPYLHRSEISEQWGGWFLGHDDLEGGNGIYGLAFDDSTNTVYYTNYNENRLRSYNLTTKEHELLWAPGMTHPLGVKLSPSRTHLLIAERGRGISAFQLDNYGYELMVDAPDAYFGVAVTADPSALPPGTPAPEEAIVLFRADFENDPVGGLPLKENAGGVWSSIAENENANGINRSHGVTVEIDESDIFGYGVENKYLHIEDNSGAFIYGNLSATAGVATLSYEFYAMRTTITPPSGSERMGFAFFDGAANRLHLHSVTGEGAIRGTYAGTGQLPVYKRARIDIILNNTEEPVTYEDPSGAEVVLDSVATHVWLDGELIADFANASSRGNNATTGNNISQIRIPTHSSTDRLSILLDNITVFEGAWVLEQLVEGVDPADPPPPPFYGHLDLDFEGIPTGEITEENADSFLHGNLTALAFLEEYDLEGADPARPLLSIGLDENNLFGEGTDNQILQTNGARGWSFLGQNNFNEEVLTFRMDMIHHGTLDESDVFSQLILRHFDAEGARVSQIAMQAGESPGTFLGQDARWEVDTVNRFEVVMNNSADALTYSSPTGTDRTVDAGASDMWINGVLAFGNHTHGRHGRATPGPIMEIQLLTNPNNVWNADIARIQTLPGAQLVGVDGPSVPEGYSDWIETYFPGESDPELVGPDADPDGDGIPNLLEYALNREPNVASREALPFTEVRTVTVDEVEGRYLVLIGAVPDDMFDLQYSVEASSDVSFAEVDEGVPVDSWSNGDGTTTYVFRDVAPIGENSRRFMRLRVTALD